MCEQAHFLSNSSTTKGHLNCCIYCECAFSSVILSLSFITSYFNLHFNCIGGVMVSVLTSSAVDRGFEPQSGQAKDYKTGICCFSAI